MVTEEQRRAIEFKAAHTLLDKGVLVDKIDAPIISKLLGRRQLKLEIFQPTLGEMIEISQIISTMSIKTNEEITEISLIEGYNIITLDAEKAIEILLIASRLNVLFWKRKRLVKYVTRKIDPERFSKIWQWFIVYNGVEDFTNTIRLMTPANNLSPMIQRSQPPVERL